MVKSKKGQTGLETIFYVLAFLFAAAILIFILYFIFNQIREPMSTALGNSVGGDTVAQAQINQTTNQTLGGVGLFNGMFPFLLLGLIIMTAISAFFISSHPAFFFVSLIILGVVVLLGVVFSNVYQQITTDANFGSTASSFNIMNLFMKYLPIIIAVVVIIVMLILWGKPGGGAQGGI